MPFLLFCRHIPIEFAAGPKVLEHVVDTVVPFEGDNQFYYRILRAHKNRLVLLRNWDREMKTRGLNEGKTHRVVISRTFVIV
jgi:predicted ATP-dependent serine protease